MYLADRIRIQPDHTAIQKLWMVSYVCKDVWNILNDRKITHSSNYYELKRMLPELKQGCERMRLPSSQVLQDVVKSLDTAWSSYFTKKRNGDTEARPPKFKSYKYFFTQKYTQNRVSFKIEGNILSLAYGKSPNDWIQITIPDREYDFATVKTVTISYDRRSKAWYASLVREVEVFDIVTASIEMAHKRPYLSPEVFCPLPVAYNPFTRRPVHILYFDPGCKTTLTGIKTDGTIWEYDINPLRQLNFKLYQLIDTLKSRRDRKKRGSRQYRRLNRKIKDIYIRINTQTKQYLHKLANRILQDHSDVIRFMVGDWDKRSTLSNTGIAFLDSRINRQVQNNNPVQRLIEYLTYKAEMQCKEVKKFNERGTTRTCSMCGHVIHEGLSPSVRVFHCEECGFDIGRDINSVLNFLKLYQYALWQGLRAIASLSIARIQFNPLSGKNRTVCIRQVILNYQDARCL